MNTNHISVDRGFSDGISEAYSIIPCGKMNKDNIFPQGSNLEIRYLSRWNSSLENEALS